MNPHPLPKMIKNLQLLLYFLLIVLIPILNPMSFRYKNFMNPKIKLSLHLLQLQYLALQFHPAF